MRMSRLRIADQFPGAEMPDEKNEVDVFALHEQRAVRKLKVIIAMVAVVILAIFLIIVIG
jgi:hypothetical protein